MRPFLPYSKLFLLFWFYLAATASVLPVLQSACRWKWLVRSQGEDWRLPDGVGVPDLVLLALFGMWPDLESQWQPASNISKWIRLLVHLGIIATSTIHTKQTSLQPVHANGELVCSRILLGSHYNLQLDRFPGREKTNHERKKDTCPSVPSAVTMVTECSPPEDSIASWAGTVMVVPSCVTMVIVFPIACMSAWEILT